MRHLISTLMLLLVVFWAASPAEAQRNAFGTAIAVSETEAIITEPSNVHTPGKVHVYYKDGSTWTERGTLQASDAFVQDAFGSAVAISGNHMIVGATAQADGAGAAYIFTRNTAGVWVEAARLTANQGQEDSNFGAAVAIDGDWALVGASEYGDDGAVFAYQKSGDSWNAAGMWTNGDEDSQDKFGSAVALHNGRAIVGAPGTPPARRGPSGPLTTGAAYAYQFSNGAWSEGAKLMGSQVEEASVFGSTIAMMGNMALIGAPRVNNGAGSVFVFSFDPLEGAWVEDVMLVPFDLEPQYAFGTSISLSSDGAWIGAPGAARSSHAGAAYFFSRSSAGNWTGVSRLAGENPETGDGFGRAIVGDANMALIGATGDDFGSGITFFAENIGGSWELTSKLDTEVRSFDAVSGDMVSCEGGQAAAFDCDNMDLAAFMPISALGGDRGVRVNDIWGWTDEETGKEYALVGRMDGTAFVDVTDAYNPRFLGDLPLTEGARPNSWRDMKVYNNHVFVVADNARDHGMQIFDLTQLRGLDGSNPVTFEATAHYDRVNSAHNVVINEESGYAYIVGASGGGDTCGGGLHMVNIQDPVNPVFEGCFADPETGRSGTGYSHDAQCVMYRGPDSEHVGKEICIGSNETAISIADVSDKANPVALSSATYPNVAYTHQGWLTEDHRYFYVNDEGDETGGLVTNTRTIIWDLTDLDDPEIVKEFLLSTESSDHNLYIRGNTMYQSNYYSGLRILDITDPENPVESGHFDTMPFGEAPGFDGSWSNYPFFESGTIVVTSISQGLFLIKKRDLGI